MRLLSLLLLINNLCFGQITITLPKSVVTESRLNAKIDSLDRALKAVIASNQGVPVKPLPNCDRGPTIQGISKISGTSLTLLFDGQNVFSMNYEILASDNSRIFIDSIRPQSNTMILSYPLIGNGSYTLRISGRNCTGVDTRKFTVKSATGEVIDIPSIPPPAQPDLGNVIPKQIDNSLPQNMNIKMFRVNDQWIFSDMAERGPPFGYEFWYGINGEIIKQSIPLRNYKWPANTPLGIWKAQARLGLSTLAKWTPDNADNGWSDSKAGATFDYNDSFPFTSFLFEKSGSGYDTTRLVTHWMDVEPDMKVPPGNVWIMPIGPLDTPESLTRKGVTHFSKYSASGKSYEGELLSAGRLYDEVPQTAQQLDLSDRGPIASRFVPGKYNEKGQWNPDPWPGVWNERFFGPWSRDQKEPGSYDKGFQAGLKYTTAYPIVIFENSEQDHALSSHWPIFKGFYDAFMPRMISEWGAKGITPLVAHNYFTTFSGSELTLGFASRQANKDIFRKPFSEWGTIADLKEGGSLYKTTAVCFGLYLGSPDQSKEVAYRLVFAAEIAKAAGKNLIAFAQPFNEWRPNNLQRQRFPEGDFYMFVKQGWNPADGITYSFLAQCFGKGFIPFSASGKTEKKFAYDRAWKGPGSLWIPKGTNDIQYNSDRFPYWANGGKESYQVGQSEYYIAEGVRLLNDTWVPTWGGKRQFLRFRIDGGNWIEVANRDMDDLVDAFFDKRGFVYSQRKGNLLSVFYLNSFADNQLHNLEYQYEGRTYTMKIHSTVVHPTISSLN